jgi:hypothetical protein
LEGSLAESIRSRSSAARYRMFRNAMLGAATTHFITFLIVTLLTIAVAAFDSIGSALFLALWNILFNAYPVALQRHNVARLDAVAHRVARQTRR